MSVATTMIMVLTLQIITYFLLLTSSTSSPHGFTIDLIQRLTNSSSLRPSNSDGSSPYAYTVYDSFEYLMKLQIGTPPVEIEGILDTWSDIIWIQCLPCIHCYAPEPPIFDPSKSSTYKEKNPYEIIYVDRSNSKGMLATETVTLHSTSGQPFVMPETTIGCSHNNSAFISTKPSGVIGLNWGALSLISQMGEDFQGLFSYCFSGKGTSKINFGGNAIVAGEGTVATNMFRKNDKPNYYYLNLDAISVGENDGYKTEFDVGTEDDVELQMSNGAEVELRRYFRQPKPNKKYES